MFDELLRELRRFETPQQIPVSMPSDDEGYFDRECPSPECLFQFKVHHTRAWHAGELCGREPPEDRHVTRAGGA